MSDKQAPITPEAKEPTRPSVEEHDRFGFRKNFERQEELKDWDRRHEARRRQPK